MKRGNAYLHNIGRLDFGVKVSYHANENNTGVERVVETATEEIPTGIILDKIL